MFTPVLIGTCISCWFVNLDSHWPVQATKWNVWLRSSITPLATVIHLHLSTLIWLRSTIISPNTVSSSNCYHRVRFHHIRTPFRNLCLQTWLPNCQVDYRCLFLSPCSFCVLISMWTDSPFAWTLVAKSGHLPWWSTLRIYSATVATMFWYAIVLVTIRLIICALIAANQHLIVAWGNVTYSAAIVMRACRNGLGRKSSDIASGSMKTFELFTTRAGGIYSVSRQLRASEYFFWSF